MPLVILRAVRREPEVVARGLLRRHATIRADSAGSVPEASARMRWAPIADVDINAHAARFRQKKLQVPGGPRWFIYPLAAIRGRASGERSRTLRRENASQRRWQIMFALGGLW